MTRKCRRCNRELTKPSHDGLGPICRTKHHTGLAAKKMVYSTTVKLANLKDGEIAVGIGTANELTFAIFTKDQEGNINRIAGGYQTPEQAARNAASYAITLRNVIPRMFVPSKYR